MAIIRPIGLATALCSASSILARPLEMLRRPPLYVLISKALSNMVLNSGRPVFGLIVPDPPNAFKSAASSGLMCARIVSPPRPCDCKYLVTSARPPWAMGMPSIGIDRSAVSCFNSCRAARRVPMYVWSKCSGSINGGTIPSSTNVDTTVSYSSR